MLRRHLPLSVLATLLAASIGGCVFITGDFNPLGRRQQPLEEREVGGSGDAKVLLVDLAGVITAEEREGAFGLRTSESSVARLEAELDKAAGDDEVRAVVVRVNSPGGTVTASDIIYERLMRFKAERRVPVLVQMMDVAASGGYYAALAGDEIIASPTSVTGSIGVIFTNISVAGLMDKLGVRDQTVASGAMKDIGSPLRTMTAAERAVLESLIGDMQARFVGLVRTRRPGLSEEMKTQMVDGRVFSADQALAGGLVDGIGYLEQTIERARLKAGLSEATVIRYRRPDEVGYGLYSRLGAPPAAGTEVNILSLGEPLLPPGPRFLYLWAP